MTAPWSSVSASVLKKRQSRKSSPGVWGLLQQLSPYRQTHDTPPEEVRFCYVDRPRLPAHLGRISDFSLLPCVHIFICSLVLLQVTSRRAAGLVYGSFLSRCSCSPRPVSYTYAVPPFLGVPASRDISSQQTR